MKYTEIVKKCKIITMQHVSKNGVVYILSGDGPETYMLTIPIHKLDDAKLQPIDKSIYFARYIREAIDENNLIALTNNL